MNNQKACSWQIILALVLGTWSLMAPANEMILPGAKPSSTQRYQFWGFEIYDARLWTSPGFSVQQYTASPFVLELSYLRNFEGAAIAKRSMDEMRKLGGITSAQEKAWLQAMTDIFPNVRAGDRLMGFYKPNEGAEFWFQQKRLGAIGDPQFAKLFFGIWLHEATPAPAIRQAWINGL
ncbi:MAG: chalcone isomerase family protein [Limnohabitans sp.]